MKSLSVFRLPKLDEHVWFKISSGSCESSLLWYSSSAFVDIEALLALKVFYDYTWAIEDRLMEPCLDFTTLEATDVFSVFSVICRMISRSFCYLTTVRSFESVTDSI